MKDMNPFGEPLPENRAALEVKEDGQIWLNDGRQSILVSDQEVAKTILLKAHRIEIDLDPIEFTVGIYPIPDLKWEVKEELEYPIDHTSYPPYRKVAVISLPESEKPIEPKREDYEFNYLYERALADYSHDLRRYYEKAKRKKLLIEMMQEDEKNGMYDKSDNELIAEFMGVREKTGNYDNYGSNAPYWFTETELFRSRSFTVPDRSFFEFLEHCKYHTSWDWLMPAWQKFRQTCWNTIGYTDDFDDYWVAFRDAVFNGNILKAHKALTDGIKWYNSTIKMKNESQKQQCFHYRKGMDEKDCEHSYNTTCECIQQESQEDFAAAFLDWWQQHSWEIEYREQRSFTAREMVEEFKLTRKP